MDANIVSELENDTMIYRNVLHKEKMENSYKTVAEQYEIHKDDT